MLAVALAERWEERVDYVGRLVFVSGRVRFSAHVSEQGPDRAGRGGRHEFRSPQAREDAPGSDVSRRRALDVPLDPRDLPRAVHVRPRPQGAVGRDRLGGVEERVPVHLAEPHPLRLLQAWYARREDPLLLRPGQAGLEAHQVPRRPGHVLAPELHHGVRPPPGAGVRQSHGLHRPVGQDVPSPLRHHFDRQAAFEITRLFELVRFHLLAAEQLVHEALVLLARQRQVQVVRPLPLAVSRLLEGQRAIDRIAGDDRRDRIVEGELRRPHRLRHRPRQGFAGERAGGHHAQLGTRRELTHFAGLHAHERLRGDARGQPAAEHHPIDGQRIAGRDPGPIRLRQHGRSQPPQLFVEEPHRVVGIVGSERV